MTDRRKRWGRRQAGTPGHSLEKPCLFFSERSTLCPRPSPPVSLVPSQIHQLLTYVNDPRYLCSCTLCTSSSTRNRPPSPLCKRDSASRCIYLPDDTFFSYSRSRAFGRITDVYYVPACCSCSSHQPSGPPRRVDVTSLCSHEAFIIGDP